MAESPMKLEQQKIDLISKLKVKTNHNGKKSKMNHLKTIIKHLQTFHFKNPWKKSHKPNYISVSFIDIILITKTSVMRIY